MSRKRHTVVLFLGDSNFGNIGSMVPALADGFREIGFDIRIIDVRTADYGTTLAGLADQEAIAAVVSVSGFGLPPTSDAPAVRVFNDLDVPIIGLFLDHPFCLQERIELPLRHYHACFPAGHAGAFCERFMASTARYHHVAHACVPRRPVDWHERDIPLLLTGSLFLPPAEQRRRWRDHGPEVEQRLNDVIDLAWQDLARPLETSVLQVLGEDIGFETVFPYMKTADDYIRNAQRVTVVQGLGHLPLTVVGPGWAPYVEQLPGIRFVGQRTIDEALAMTGQAKAVLNPFPGYNDSHERVFNAMAGGTAVISSRSTLYDRTFNADEITFLPNEPADAGDTIAAFLGEDAQVAAMAACGRQNVFDAHTWVHRARELAQVAGLQMPTPH